ncbi:2-amino-4-hydroxy-6-hydroxymethyldihydropteridine diphosphokinase [Neobacillus niacini]|uniref:2-amino-4-hydroxy-6- hydroxymethyldihydropteridine diphosphokinase n=1 Tax=Neobacillus niacini TaxID=86668 RepID=UPI0007AB4884|nr:2-amino-4-hydroxy-6-hydroxymethyldihydropteridine diphosphokinase [Neobacillus niacini]MEC1525218.1 2-amino-4-hydroxy-6-hydroxymethyldihydropteridine diphosphokinase [Neobacillus niacini]
MGNTAFIALGSNIGDRYDYLSKAVERLVSHSKIQLVNTSSVYETDPVGYEEQDLFLNMVMEIQTDLSAFELLDFCLKVELELGRKREIMWGPRTVDLDILLYNQENIKSEKLMIPHPRMLERNFVMIPLSEIKPNITIPNTEKPLEVWIEELPNKEGVRVWKRKNGEDVFEPIGN